MKSAQSTGEEVISGTDDILSEALGTEEHRGQVRGMGKYITPHQYFYLPKTVKEYMASENKKFDNRFSKLEGAVDRLQTASIMFLRVLVASGGMMMMGMN